VIRRFLGVVGVIVCAVAMNSGRRALSFGWRPSPRPTRAAGSGADGRPGRKCRLVFVLGVASVIDGPWLACRWQVAAGWAHPAAAPLSALLRIGGKRKPRSTEASGASRTGNFGEGAGALFPVHLRKTTTRAGLRSGGSQQLGQLGDVGGDAPRLVAGERCAHVYAPARLLRAGFE
jgi:hypothetical protein